MTDETVVVDEGNTSDETEESKDESNLNNQTEVENQETDAEANEGEDEVKLTEKGTKLDPNPQSAIHQELANAKSQIKQMEDVLTKPALLKRYAEQNGMSLSEAKADLKDEKEEVTETIEEFSPENFKTSGDVASALNKINKSLAETKAENQRLREGQKGINSSRESERIVNNMQRDISAVQDKYPVLNPKSPEYNKNLEESVGKLYHKLDFDPATKTFRGNVSVVDIAETVMGATKLAKKQGSREAQTDVTVKQAGKVNSGKGKSKSTPTEGLTIAQKIKKAYQG